MRSGNLDRRYLVLAACLVVLLGGFAAYLARVPPFAKRGEIAAEDMCGFYQGDRRTAADAALRVVPEEPKYEVLSHDPVVVNDPVVSGKMTFEGSCIIRGGSASLMSANVTQVSTSMKGSGKPSYSPKSWAREQTHPGYAEESAGRVSFDAGARGVADSRIAGVYVPCRDWKELDSAYYLSVKVEALKEPDTSATESRQALADLAVLTARHLHERAKCTFPSELPRTAPDLGEIE